MQLILFKDTVSAKNPPFFQNSFLYLLSNGNQDYTSDRQRMYRFRSRYTFFRFLLTTARRGNRLHFWTIGARKNLLAECYFRICTPQSREHHRQWHFTGKRNYRPNSPASGMDTARTGASIGMGEGNGATPFQSESQSEYSLFHWTNYLPVSMNWGWKRNCTINV